MIKLKYYNCLIVALLLACNVFSQQENIKNQFISPLLIKPVLSGNFAEPRSRHFHTGLDYNTSKDGQEIIAVNSGYISRIYVSPWGYGLALYVNHPNGYTSVYGHLSMFNPEIQSFVRKCQYENCSFNLDTTLSDKQFTVVKGDCIAFSGNTGFSEGPHLHFELRETETEMPINTVSTVYDFKDTKAPEVTNLVLYPLADNSFIDGKHEKQIYKLVKNKDGIYTPLKELPKVCGVIGVGLVYVDRMDDSPNRFGAESVKLYSGSEIIYYSSVQKVSFDMQRAKNSMFDYQYFLEEAMHVHKLFVEKGNNLNLYPQLVNDGFISVAAGEEKQLSIAVGDYNSNISRVEFDLLGDSILYFPIPHTEGILLKFEESFIYADGGFRLEFDSASLFYDYNLKIEKIAKWKYSDVYRVGEDFVAIKKDFNVMFFLDENLLKIKDKLFIGRKHNGTYDYIKSTVSKNYISASSSYFGEFYLGIDTTPPVITPVNISENTKISLKSSISVKIEDASTGVKNYNMYINNSWVLAQYDPRKKTLTYYIDELMPEADKYELLVIVEDNMGNVKEFRANFLVSP